MSDSRTGQRFPLELPIKLHGDDVHVDLRGTTENLSAAAVYIRAATDLQPGAKVEFEIKLPREVTGGACSVTVQCRGRVVRADDGAENGPRGVACVIDSYDFVRV